MIIVEIIVDILTMKAAVYINCMLWVFISFA